MPGVDPSSIELTVEKNVLTVKAQRTHQWGDGVEVLVNERPAGSFTRQLSLSDSLGTDLIVATCDNGVLTVAIPVTEERATARKIEIGDAWHRHRHGTASRRPVHHPGPRLGPRPGLSHPAGPCAQPVFPHRTGGACGRHRFGACRPRGRRVTGGRRLASLRLGREGPPMNDFTVQARVSGTQAVVTVERRPRRRHAPPSCARSCMAVIAGGADRLVLDLRRVTFIESVALGVIIAARRQRRRGRQERVHRPAPRSDVDPQGVHRHRPRPGLPRPRHRRGGRGGLRRDRRA